MTSSQNSLQAFQLFQGISRETLDKLLNVAQIQTFHAGEIIFKEGSTGDELYLILSGTLEVLKSTDSSDFVVTEMTEKSHFGELSFLDGSPRSATIRAKTDVSVYILEKKAIIEHASSGQIMAELFRNIALWSSERLKHRTSNYADSLEKQLSLLQEKNYFNRFLLTITGTYSIVLVITSLLGGLLKHINMYSQSYSWLYLMILVGPVLLFVLKSGEPIRHFGVTTSNWKRSCVEGLVLSLGVIVLGFGLLSLLSRLGWMAKTSISLPGFLYVMFVQNFFMLILYFINSYAQEFLARGVFQSSIQRAFEDEKGWKSVLLASFIFGVAHIPYGAALVGVTLISGIFFGFLFMRHKNLLGVSIVHSMLGSFLFSMAQLPFMDKMA